MELGSNQNFERFNAALIAGIWIILALIQIVSTFFLPDRYFCSRSWECSKGKNTPFKPLYTWDNQSCGDLSILAGVPQIKQYRQEIFHADEYGFRNPSGQMEKHPQAVVVGDSFGMSLGLSDEDTIAALIEKNMGIPSYSFAPLPVSDFYYDNRFMNAPPKVVVLVIAERNLFPENVYITPDRLVIKPKVTTRAEVFSPIERLKHPRKNMEKFNFLSIESEKILKGAKWALGIYSFPDTIYHFDKQSRHLFFSQSGRLQEDPHKQLERLELTLRILKDTQVKLNNRNIHLIVAVIPNKEAIYANLIPQLHGKNVFGVLDRFCEGMKILQIDYVNVQKTLSNYAATHPDDNLYMIDDTHPSALSYQLIFDKIRPKLTEIMTEEK